MTQWSDSYGAYNIDPFSRSIEERNWARQLDRMAVAHPGTSVSSITRAGGTPPIVTGITLVQAIDRIHIQWSATPIADLKFYEVQIATNSTFTQDVILKKTGEDEYVWEEGDEDITYWLRVRAVNNSNNGGAWSARVNSATGKVYTAIIDVDATSNVTRFIYGDDTAETFTNLTDTGTTSEDYGNLTIDVFDSDSVVSPTIIFEFDYSAVYTVANTCHYTTSLFRREQGTTPWGAAINSAQNDIKSTIPGIGSGTARAQVPAFVNYDEPGQGIWEYKVRVAVTAGGANTISFQGVMLEMEFWQTKR
ncbi:MAG: hypothetical protein ACYTFQ_00050 [Planctomycetota bacterium]|jgi:hypothetical protein